MPGPRLVKIVGLLGLVLEPIGVLVNELFQHLPPPRVR